MKQRIGQNAVVGQQRYLYLDYLKCFATFCVVFGHALSWLAPSSRANEVVYFHFIITFHMPLFAFISGYLFRNEGRFAPFMKKKMSRMVIPYFVWALVYGLALPALQYIRHGRLEEMGQLVAKFPVYALTENLWFIRALIFSLALGWLSMRWGGVKMLLLSCLLVYVVSLLGLVPIGEGLKGFVFLYPFFCSGIVWRRMEGRWTMQRKMFFTCSLVCFMILLIGWNGFQDTFYLMNNSVFEAPGYVTVSGWKVVERTLYRYAIGLAGSMAFFLGAQLLWQARVSAGTVGNVCSMIGRNTLGIYLLNGVLFYGGSLSRWLQGEECAAVGCFVLSIGWIALSVWIIKFTSRNGFLARALWGEG